MLTITIPVMLILIYFFDLPYLPVMFVSALVMCIAAWGVSHDRFVAQAGAGLLVIAGAYFLFYTFFSDGLASSFFDSAIEIMVVIVVVLTMFLAAITGYKETLKV